MDQYIPLFIVDEIFQDAGALLCNNVNAMLTWVAAGHEAVPGNARVGWNSGAEIAADAGLDQTCQVGHQPLIEVGLQNAPVRAVQSNNKHFADHGYPLRDLLTIR